ncbi:hypothetical protein WOU_02461, partial [Enterococcus faecalis ATCC 6055]
EKQLFVYIKGKLKDADFSQYVDDKGNIMIPNVAQLIINTDDVIDSNKVNVTTPQEKPEILPNTSMDIDSTNGTKAIALVTGMAVIGLAGYLVSVKKKGKE